MLCYKKTHVPTGNTEVLQFNGSHGEAFGDFNIQPKHKVLLKAKEVVARWNTFHPDTWHYKVVEEECQPLE